MKHHPLDLAGQLSSLEKFASDQSAFEVLEATMAEFDAFAFLGLSSSEEVHSNILAWLLDPKENHSLGEFFLKAFLLETGVASEEEIRCTDWSDTTVQREWHNVVDNQTGYVDILVVNHAGLFACAIENKIFSGEHGSQLAHYRRALEERYNPFRKSYLFLSPQGMAPKRPAEREFWRPLDYVHVLRLVESVIEESAGLKNDSVAAFLRQYAMCLRRTVVPSTELRAAATRIYLRHREAIDLIIRYKDSYVAELKEIFREAIEHQGDWKVVPRPEKLLGFVPSSWEDFEDTRIGSAPKRKAEEVLLFDFDFRDPGTITLILTIRPGDLADPLRNSLFQMAEGHPEIFNPRGSPMGGRYTNRWIRLHVSEHILSDADFSDWDEAAVHEKIVGWIADFREHQFPSMNAAIVECFRGTSMETNSPEEASAGAASRHDAPDW